MSNTQAFPHKDEMDKILGACFEVYKEKSCGFLEPTETVSPQNTQNTQKGKEEI